MVVFDDYSVVEINPVGKGYHDEDSEEIEWSELKGLKNIKSERIRFVSDTGYPYMDLSYFHIRIEGKRYRVINSPFDCVDKNNYKNIMYKILKKENVFIKDLFDSISVLY